MPAAKEGGLFNLGAAKRKTARAHYSKNSFWSRQKSTGVGEGHGFNLDLWPSSSKLYRAIERIVTRKRFFESHLVEIICQARKGSEQDQALLNELC